jgi:hypothetical protein
LTSLAWSQAPTLEDSYRILDLSNGAMPQGSLLEDSDGGPDVLHGVDNSQECGNLSHLSGSQIDGPSKP